MQTPFELRRRRRHNAFISPVAKEHLKQTFAANKNMYRKTKICADMRYQQYENVQLQKCRNNATEGLKAGTIWMRKPSSKIHQNAGSTT